MNQHEITKGLNYNYLQDAAYYYWAARGLELNFRSTEPNEQVIDKLIVRRLRQLAEKCTELAVKGIQHDIKSVSNDLDLFNKLLPSQTQNVETKETSSSS